MGSQRVQHCPYTRFEFNINFVWNTDAADAVEHAGSWVLDGVGYRPRKQCGGKGKLDSFWSLLSIVTILLSLDDHSNSSSVWSELHLPVRNLSLAPHFHCLEFQEKRFLGLNLKLMKLYSAGDLLT